jgi:beta-N-acetylhexosaminidase
LNGSIQGGNCLLVGIGGPVWAPAEEAAVRAIQPAGLVLFRRNLSTPAATARLVARLGELIDGPSIVAIDQEGGPVSRLEPWIGPTPSAARLARRDAGRTRAFAAETARALAALGIQLDFAPVVDLS